MTHRFFILALAPLSLSACMLTPVEQEPRWTDAALAQQPPGAAPVFIPTRTLSAADRAALTQGEVAALAAGDETRTAGEPLREPAEDAAAYAAEARERARPPQND